MFKVKRFVNLILFVLIVCILMSPAICKAEDTVTFSFQDYEPIYYPATIEIPYIPYTNPVVFQLYQFQDSNPLPALPITLLFDSNPLPAFPISPYLMSAGAGLLYQGINPGTELFVPAFSVRFGGGYAGMPAPDQDPDDLPPWIAPYASSYGYYTSPGSYYSPGIEYGYGAGLDLGFYLDLAYSW